MELTSGAKLIIKTLNDCGSEGYAVGGFVRNSLLGLKVTDIDIIPDENGPSGYATDTGELILIISVCSLTMAGGSFVLISVLLKRKKTRKWTKI